MLRPRDRDPDDARDMQRELEHGPAADRREQRARRRAAEVAWVDDLQHSDGPFAGPGERMAY